MINSRMQDHMADATAKWGVRLNRIEILDITSPMNVVQAMSEQKEAEQHKRAAILKSEGDQQRPSTRPAGASRLPSSRPRAPSSPPSSAPRRR